MSLIGDFNPEVVFPVVVSFRSSIPNQVVEVNGVVEVAASAKYWTIAGPWICTSILERNVSVYSSIERNHRMKY